MLMEPKLPILSSDSAAVADYHHRIFHVEVLKGGMNRLLLRSHPTSVDPMGIEVLFMSVQYMQLGCDFDGLMVYKEGVTEDVAAPWTLDSYLEASRYRLRSSKGEGFLIAAAMEVRSAVVDPDAPSLFFMMD